MEVKFLGDNHEIKIYEVKTKNIQGIIDVLKTKSSKFPADDSAKIIVFANGKKIEDFNMSFQDANIDENSKLYILLKSKKDENKAKAESNESKNKTESNVNNNQFSSQQNLMNGMMGGDLMGNIDPEMISNMLKDPAAVDTILAMSFPNLSPEQREMYRPAFEMAAKNPDLIKQVFQNGSKMGMGGMSGNPNMMGNQPNMMGNQPNMMGNQPNMMGFMPQSPQMSPNGMMGMQSPNMMYNPMMNYGMPYYGAPNPYYMMPNQAHPHSPAPANGPCDHGFYPPVYIEGKPTGKNAELVYATQLQSLYEMGFTDRSENIQALIKARGDIDKALDELSKNK